MSPSTSERPQSELAKSDQAKSDQRGPADCGRTSIAGGAIGILGGMGPLATIDFMRKIIEVTPAGSDQDHVPVLAFSIPQIPDRTASLLGEGPSPLPLMSAVLARLEAAGAACVAMPCNTAHHWYDSLSAEAHVPILHIARETAAELASRGCRRAALLATRGTIASGYYGDILREWGIELVRPGDDAQARISLAIAQIKAGQVEAAGVALGAVAEAIAVTVDSLILGCTEIPVALQAIAWPLLDRCVDPTQILAHACVDWYSRNVRLLPHRPG